ncbi:hypothetical protein HGRIS_001437 [Hohenbuehelia grisea]|uniref:Uncharacterized protein n=1 Tax=Hohenbuehelia grisea TaxID=104357 RepID=A0ABR3IP93_9AGAR
MGRRKVGLRMRMQGTEMELRICRMGGGACRCLCWAADVRAIDGVLPVVATAPETTNLAPSLTQTLDAAGLSGSGAPAGAVVVVVFISLSLDFRHIVVQAKARRRVSTINNYKYTVVWS